MGAAGDGSALALCGLTALAGLLGASPTVLAGGFAITEQSASAAGTATAGAAALAEDAGTVFYNPAGMALLEGSQLLAAAQGFFLDNEFTDHGTVDGTGNPISGSEDIRNDIIPIGSLFAVLDLHERVKVGLGITSPFGLASEYDDDWVGRYNTLLSGITTVNINPSMAVRIADWLSLGAGLSVQYAEGRRRNDLDFGSICFNQLLGPGACTGLGILPQGADGRLTIEADDWGVGYNFGILVQPLSGTRIGLAYRSEIHQTLRGDADYDVPAIAAPLTFGGTLFQNTGAKAEITFPSSFSLSLYHELTPQIALLGDVTWTGWHNFETLRIEFENPSQPDTVQEEKWRDTFRYSFGLLYRPAEDYVLRAGFAYDETPVRGALRNPGIPANDRLVFALGGGMEMTKSLAVDFAYTYNHEFDAQVKAFRTESGSVVGTYENRVHILSAQLRWRF